MPTVIHGTNDAIKQGRNRTWSRFQGDSEEVTYDGPSAPIEALFTSLRGVTGSSANYDSLHMQTRNGFGTLNVVQSGYGISSIAVTSDGDTMYELLSVEANRPIQYHPYFKSMAGTVNGIAAWNFGVIFALYNKSKTLPDGTPITDASVAYAELNPSSDSVSVFFHKLLESGVHEYIDSYFVLRSSRLVSQRSQITTALTGVNTAFEGGSVIDGVSAINALIGSISGGQWLKRSPNIQTSGKRKWKITQEWWHAREGWLANIYTGGTYELGS